MLDLFVAIFNSKLNDFIIKEGLKNDISRWDESDELAEN